MTLCAESVLVNQGDASARAVTMYCRSWHCDICNPRRQKQLIAAIADGQPQRLLTLTTRWRKDQPPTREAKFMALAFRQLIRKIRKRWPGVDHQYFAVFEAHKTGWPHLHVALRGCFIPWRWLSETWEELTGSPGVDIRYVPNVKKCAGYVAKYMGKDTQRFGTCKRYWRSKNWEVDPPEEKGEDGRWSSIWEPRNVTIHWLAETWSTMGWLLWRNGDTLYGGADPPPGVKVLDPAEVW